MKVYCHGVKISRSGLVSYTGLKLIENVEEVVIYNDKEKIIGIFEKADYSAVAIFAPTVFVVKKSNQYQWSDVKLQVNKAETVAGLQNGKNYVKEKETGVWMLIEEVD